MREIKFRAWVKQDNKMVEVKSLHLGTQKIMYGYSNNWQSYGNKTTSLEDCLLMQYTNMKDKKGREIYEGDVVKSNDDLKDIFGVAEYNDEDVGSCGCCYPRFNGTGFVFRIIGYKDKYFSTYEIEKCEVIGNIYENETLIDGDYKVSPMPSDEEVE